MNAAFFSSISGWTRTTFLGSVYHGKNSALRWWYLPAFFAFHASMNRFSKRLPTPKAVDSMISMPFLRSICSASVIRPSSAKYGASETCRMSTGSDFEAEIMYLLPISLKTSSLTLSLSVLGLSPAGMRSQANFTLFSNMLPARSRVSARVLATLPA